MANMEQTKRASRKKACEACRVKKRKCDGKRPTCSHCLIYSSDCLWSADVHSSRPPSSPACQKQTEMDRLRSRLSQVEAQFESFQAQIDELKGEREPAAAQRTACQTPFRLPDIVPLIGDYFAVQNTVMPLFDKDSFMKTLHAWHVSPADSDDGAWASINVVLASAIQRAEHGIFGQDFLQRCIDSAQAALGNILTRDMGLQGLQAVLGLVMLSQGALDLRPTAVLAAVAVQLAYKLKLHIRQGYGLLPPEDRRTASRVFWISYILDREIGIRTGDPYLLREESLDVDPSDDVLYNGSVLGDEQNSQDDSSAAFDWFSCRIALARIQGRVNDLLLSHRAEKSPAAARASNIDFLDGLLQEWLASVPEEFRPQALTAAGEHVAARHSLLLFASYYFSLFVAHGVLLHNDEWMEQLTKYGSRYVIAHHGPADAMPQLPFPVRWGSLLLAARACMAMFRLVDRSDTALLGAMRCSYVSAFIIMVANGLDFSRDRIADTESDAQLKEEGLHFLGGIYEETKDDRFRRLYFACSGLMFETRDRHCGHEVY